MIREALCVPNYKIYSSCH